MTYWTNFDSWIDFVTLFFWVAGIAMVGMGMVGAANAPTEEESEDTSAPAEEEAPEAAEEESKEAAEEAADE